MLVQLRSCQTASLKAPNMNVVCISFNYFILHYLHVYIGIKIRYLNASVCIVRNMYSIYFIVLKRNNEYAAELIEVVTALYVLKLK